MYAIAQTVTHFPLAALKTSSLVQELPDFAIYVVL